MQFLAYWEIFALWQAVEIRRMRPSITPCVIKPIATYAVTADRFHSPAASADA
ncbi:hypothetical protein ALO36_103017 [Pseudomonas syringae pv. tomato]|uniref:Uncharacterized protein n=3 Tax=Pseudomonas syringae group TaxID=136849 RepID=Q88BG9_PSESM|nr:protein of unknown function [Pseudomonas syringae pv. tomato str. DC3000]KAA8699620.1 hypothetical protein F4W70_26605 [Pseudomonas cannabina]KPB91746.1 Uncharacterized protein AC506_3711 [Pseudomonas syringae pv. maculicola str. M6]KPB92865.1 Uncharacterized protein AC502_1391 [Pseudomonas syringae pv. maculicola]KPY92530.1 hypothetical protein ALO36_103017 [Pseudomonas syringae pv. tomato]